MSEETIAPYRKKKDSSTSKSSKKSNHKHVWEECFLHAILPEKNFGFIQDPVKMAQMRNCTAPGFRCVFCGRLKRNYDLSLRYERDGSFLRMFTSEELLRLHPEWIVYEVPGEDWYKL